MTNPEMTVVLLAVLVTNLCSLSSATRDYYHDYCDSSLMKESAKQGLNTVLRAMSDDPAVRAKITRERSNDEKVGIVCFETLVGQT